jgi:hypothetical protein
MRFLKNFLMSIGAVALAAALVNLFVPKAVHAAVAALVEVSNPVTSPALTSRIDDHGRVPYANHFNCSGNSGCDAHSGPVPANHRLVIEHISADLSATNGSFGVCYALPSSSGIGPSFLVGPAQNAGIFTGLDFDQQVFVTVDQNQELTLSCLTSSAISGTVKAFGYLLDCNAGPCAAIASF